MLWHRRCASPPWFKTKLCSWPSSTQRWLLLPPAASSLSSAANHNTMAKRVASSSSSKKATAAAAAASSSSSPSSLPSYLKAQGHDTLLQVWVKPNAKTSAITEVNEEGLGVSLNAPPVEGKANSELLSFMAETLQVKKNQVSLHKGAKSRAKAVLISNTSPEEILRLLHRHLPSSSSS
ncbi:hypothetical protein QOT17_008468 [Balamuthia mandrillaris]